MQQFTQNEVYKNEDLYDIITDEFQAKKSLGIIDEWVEIEDLYIDDEGVYAIPFYKADIHQEEGHGLHNIADVEPDFTKKVDVISFDEVMAREQSSKMDLITADEIY